MNKVLLICFSAFACCFPFFSSAQINLKLAPLSPGANTFGVYAKVCDNITPSGNTITGSGQVTIKFPANANLNSLVSHAGLWAQNATIASPSEAAAHTYVSFGFVSDSPQIIYQPDSETLLFTFKLVNTATTPVLIENGVDPFDHLPNSVNSNPGNELTVLDFGVQPLGLYTYAGNYAGNATICSETPQDTTTVINPPIDTTNNTDTTVIDTTNNTDTTVIDTTTQGGGGDTTVIDTTQGGGDTTVINSPNDTTQQTSGVFDLSGDGKHFTLYPTPAFEWVMVEFLEKDANGGSIRLFTFNGVPIGEMGRAGRGSIKLNVSGLSSGLYILSYEKDGQVMQRSKFLKQ
ncbi:MAG: T9SS type A sorting domain-containing protein [Saprospiraceae bacterium]|nr:T9SS type A sorting domain-containing protein [Saprospiraceae bacterium]